ncbi:MAG: GntR family transcriptional regulator, partial [Eggerthellaceae bacterium]|nr:GntR family transcriptional regulator [Eggerthellaceae bacterium]
GKEGSSNVEIIISNSSDKPIYEQISSQIKNAILSGELSTGQALPSIRSLASDLNVSVITTKRAYSDLETLGFIETRQGKGSFVAGGNLELLREEQLRHIESLLQKALREAETASVSLSELHDILDTLAES